MVNRSRRPPRRSRPRVNRSRQLVRAVSRLRANVPYKTRRIPPDPPFRSLNFERTFTHRVNIVNLIGSSKAGFNMPTNFWDPVVYVFASPDPSKQDLSLQVTPLVLAEIVQTYYARTNVDIALTAVKLWGPMTEDIAIQMEFGPNENDPESLMFGSDSGTATKRPRLGFTSPQKYWISPKGGSKNMNLIQAKFSTSYLSEAHKTNTFVLGYMDLTISTRNNIGTAGFTKFEQNPGRLEPQ